MARRRWNPRLHPRDPRNGQFIERLGGGGGTRSRGRSAVERNPTAGRPAAARTARSRAVTAEAGARGVAVRRGGTTVSVNRRRAQVRYSRTILINRSVEGHVSALAEIRTRQGQRSYLERLNTWMLRKLIGSLPGPLSDYAQKLIARRAAERRN